MDDVETITKSFSADSIDGYDVAGQGYEATKAETDMDIEIS